MYITPNADVCIKRKTKDKDTSGKNITLSTSSLIHTRGEVIPFVPEVSFAVKFLLSQLIQQTLVLILLMRRGCPLLDKVCSTANAVTLVA